MSASKRQAVSFDDEIFLVNGVYFYRGTPYGTKKRREVSLRLREGVPQKDVLKAKRELLVNLERGGSRGGKNSFDHISELYIEAREHEAKDPDNLSERTAHETASITRQHFQPFFGTKRVEDIDQPLFNDYCRVKNKKGLNLVNHRKVLNHFLKWCVHEGFLKYRLELEIPKVAQKKRRKRVVLSEDQIKALLTACMADTGTRLRLYVLMYLLMGMRNKEICQLRWDEVDLRTAAIQINPKSNRRRKSRVIPINSYVLAELKKRERKNAYVFPSGKGSKKPHMDPTGGIRKRWNAALAKAGLVGEITPHDLRATFEKFMHTNKNFTDTRREKMAGAAIDVQKNIYVSMDASDLRGLEESVQFKGLNLILGGNLGGKTTTKAKRKAIND